MKSAEPESRFDRLLLRSALNETIEGYRQAGRERREIASEFGDPDIHGDIELHTDAIAGHVTTLFKELPTKSPHIQSALKELALSKHCHLATWVLEQEERYPRTVGYLMTFECLRLAALAISQEANDV